MSSDDLHLKYIPPNWGKMSSPIHNRIKPDLILGKDKDTIEVNRNDVMRSVRRSKEKISGKEAPPTSDVLPEPKTP